MTGSASSDCWPAACCKRTNVSDDDAIDIITGGAGADLIIGDRSLLGDGAIDLIALQSAQDRLIALN